MMRVQVRVKFAPGKTRDGAGYCGGEKEYTITGATSQSDGERKAKAKAKSEGYNVIGIVRSQVLN